MLNDDVTITGHFHAELRDKRGQLKQVVDVPNLVVSTGRVRIAGRMVGAANVMTHMALGSSTTAPTLADTALLAELSPRVMLSSSTASSNVVTYAAVFGAGVATGAVTEAGIFDADVGGTMLNRATFPVINKGVDDTVTVTWTVTFQ